MNEINDVRDIKAFGKFTFSNFKTSDVKKQLKHTIINKDINMACFWSAELICSGLYLDLWEVIILLVGKHIYIANPKLPVYIFSKYNEFRNIINNGFVNMQLSLRNNEKFRHLFVDVISVLCYSRKKHELVFSKISKDEFSIEYLTKKCSAPSLNYYQLVFRKKDQKEYIIPINEFIYHISSESRDTTMACYWIEWILEMETTLKRKKSKDKCEDRYFMNVNSSFRGNIVWLIWEALLKTENKFSKKIITALLNIFSIVYSSGTNKKRKFLLYYAVSIITEKYNIKEEICKDWPTINATKKNIEKIYKEIKKSEQSPKTDYLFKNGKTDAQKTIEKLEHINKLDLYIPRD